MADDIKAMMDEYKPMASIATAGFINGTSNATITRIGAQFFFTDGTSENVGPKNVTIRPGERDALQTTAVKCCNKIVAAIQLFAGGKVINLPPATHNGAPGECIILHPFAVVPKKSIAIAEFEALAKSNDPSALFIFEPEAP